MAGSVRVSLGNVRRWRDGRWHDHQAHADRHRQRAAVRRAAAGTTRLGPARLHPDKKLTMAGGTPPPSSAWLFATLKLLRCSDRVPGSPHLVVLEAAVSVQ